MKFTYAVMVSGIILALNDSPRFEEVDSCCRNAKL